MRVLICPDKFAGTLDAGAAARAMADGWRSVAPGDTIDARPLADGGPGFVEVLDFSLVGTRLVVPTTDPLGRPVNGSVLLVGATAYVESADACGLHLVKPEELNPAMTTSYGLGALVRAAVDAGAHEIVIGLGGSATNDGGAGFLASLGAQPVDENGAALAPGGAALKACASLAGRPNVAYRLVGATDVDAPLTGIYGATAIFGPQKGASREDVMLLDGALERFGGVLAKDLGPADLASRPGAGAAGGLGAAILALGGELISGIGLVCDLTGLDAALDEADLVITGEGSLDAQSLRGKVVGGVANGARDRGVPCVVLAGESSAGRRESLSAGVSDVYTLVGHFGSVDEAMTRPTEGLFALAARLAAQWSR